MGIDRPETEPRRFVLSLTLFAAGALTIQACSAETNPDAVSAVANTTSIPSTTIEATQPPLIKTTTTTEAAATTTSTSPSATTTTEASTTTIDFKEAFSPYVYEVGERVGRIYTDNGLIDTDVYLTDSLIPERQVKIPQEGPELDYIHHGAGLSLDYGFPGTSGNSVILAHNTRQEMDFFRHLPEVKAGTQLTLEYEKNGFRDVLIFEARTDAFFVTNKDGAPLAIYNEDQGYESSLTTYACNTVNGHPDQRAVVVWELIEIQSVNDFIDN